MVRFLAKVIQLLTPKRRWLQFSLSTLFVVVTLFSVWLSNRVNPVRLLAQQLNDESEDVRRDAARKLGCMGRNGKGAVDSLVVALNDESTKVRSTAAWAISRVGGDPEHLVPLLSDSDDTVRLAVAEAILWAGGDAAEVVPTLLELAANRKNAGKQTMEGRSALNYDALKIFSALGPEPAAAAIPSLFAAIMDGTFKSAAVQALTNLPDPAVSVVPRLIEALRHESPFVRSLAAQQLGRLGPKASEAVGDLRRHLSDTDRSAALAAAAALGAVAPGDRGSFAVLKAALRANDEPELQVAAAEYLRALGPTMTTGAVEELIQMFDNDKGETHEVYFPFVVAGALQRIGPKAVATLENVLLRGAKPSARRSAAIMLGTMEPAAPTAMPALIAALDDADELVRLDAARMLGKFGVDASAAVPRLCEWLCSDSFRLRSAAGSALEDIGMLDATGRAHLKAALVDDRPVERLVAARTLTFCGEPADTVMPTLMELAPNGHETFAELAWLRQLGSAAVPQFVELLGHRDPRVRGFAAEALGKIGPAANDAVPALIALLGDHSLRDGGNQFKGEVHEAAIEALGRIGPTAAPAVPQFMALLDTSAPNPSDPLDPLIVVITALGRIGSASREAIPTMMIMSRQDNRYLMGSVCVALARIDPKSPYLIPCLKQNLAAAERESVEDDFFPRTFSSNHVFSVVDVFWEPGVKAESLVPELRRMVYSRPLLNLGSRLYAAYALARFPSERSDAVGYLREVSEQFLGDVGERGLATNLMQKIEQSVAVDSGENAPSESPRNSKP